MADEIKPEQKAAEVKQFPEWGELYRAQPVETMPWYYDALDPDLESALSRLGIKSGLGLDIGSGPGTQSIALAERGFRMTGTDLAQSAVEQAAAKAKERGVDVDFKVDDILHTALTGPFVFAFDRGCFHVMPPEKRREYARIVAGLLPTGGYLFLKTFSTLQLGERGPYRFSPDDIKAVFSDLFEILSIDATVYQGTLDPSPHALFSTLKKI